MSKNIGVTSPKQTFKYIITDPIKTLSLKKA